MYFSGGGLHRAVHRDLSPTALGKAVAVLAGSKEVSDFALDTSATRTYRELFCDEHLGAWVIRWGEAADTGFHDHDVSAGAVYVLEGQVREERLALGGKPRVRTFEEGESFAFEASDIHRVSHAGRVPALTVHLYSPPLSQMGAYLIEKTGVLRRMTITHEEELRPLTPS
jgi:hypothetical protein